MIGLPSGLERVRWNEFGQFTAAGHDAEDRRTAGDGGLVAFEHQRTGAFGHDETVTVLRERFGGGLGWIVLGRQRRQQRKPDQRFRIDRAVGRHAQRGVGFAAANGFHAELDRGGARRAGGRERNWRSLGAEFLGKMSGHRAEHETVMIRRVLSAAADRQDIVDVEIRPADGATDFDPLRPFDLDRRDREEQRSGKIAPAADARLLERLLGGDVGEPLGEGGRGGWVDGHEIDGSGHRALQAVDRKARHGPDAGLPRGELRPVIGLAGAERCDDAHAGDDDNRSSGFIAWCCHEFPRQSLAALLRCLDQGHALALPVTGPDDCNLGRRPRHFNLQPGGIVGREHRST